MLFCVCLHVLCCFTLGQELCENGTRTTNNQRGLPTTSEDYQQPARTTNSGRGLPDMNIENMEPICKYIGTVSTRCFVLCVFCMCFVWYVCVLCVFCLVCVLLCWCVFCVCFVLYVCVMFACLVLCFTLGQELRENRANCFSRK
jgi:hypothetical protein